MLGNEKMTEKEFKVHEATTMVDMEEFQLKWNLKILSPSGHVIPGNHKSPIFVGGTKRRFTWQLEWMSVLAPSTNYYHNLVRLNVLNEVGSSGLNDKGTELQIAATIMLKDGHNAKLDSVSPLTCPKENIVSSGGILPARIEDSKNGYLTDGMITITCKILLKYGENCLSFGNDFDPVFAGVQALCDDLNNLLNCSDSGDVTLRTTTKDFSVHKFILIARSRVFAAMFRSNMVEASENIVEISDTDEDAVALMLEYIYTGKTSQTNEDKSKCEGPNSELLRLADKYELEGLKKQTEFKLASKVNVDNVVQCWVLANLYNASNLKSASIQFIHRNKAKLLELPSFQTALKTHPELLMELYASV